MSALPETPPPAYASVAGELAGFAIEALLEPIPGAQPSGADLRYAGDYDRIQEARQEDDPSLPQGIWQRQLKRADWDVVAQLCAEALTKRSKDLQIAAWLVEAGLRRQGIAALAPAFIFLAEFCRRFWSGLFPAAEGDDLDTRLAPLDWLNDRLPVLLHQLPVTQASGTAAAAYSWADYRNAERHEIARQRDPKSAARAEAAGRVILPVFLDAVARTPNSFFVPLHAELAAGAAALAGFVDLLDELCGRQAPNLSGMRDAIDELETWARTILMERNALPVAAPPPVEVEEAAATVPVADDEIVPPGDGPIRNREDAYRRLAEVAEYLFRVEPHSPTPYLVQRAVTWGRMPLHELLPELARRGDLSQLFYLLGLPERR